jgi:FAD binding domain/Berberine and berberine like
MKRKEFIKLSSMAGASCLLSSNNLLLQDPTATAQNSIEWICQGDPNYDILRKGFNNSIDLFPQVIVVCKTTEDVAVAIKYANIHKLPVAIKSGGHSMEGFSCNQGGLVVNLSKMNSVEFLPNDKIKVGPGCELSSLYEKTLARKRIIPAGSCASVGMGGLTTGGGYGLFSRKYGLTCDSLVEATMVDGQGEIHNTLVNPELLWAIRGGGSGNFGVITEMVFRSYPAPNTMRSYHFESNKLDAQKASSLLEKWFAFSEKLTESCYSGYVLNGRSLNILVTNFGNHTPELQKELDAMALHFDEFTMVRPINLADKVKRYYGSKIPMNFKNSSAGLFNQYAELASCITDVLDKVINTRGMIYQVNTLGGKIADPDFEKTSCYPHRGYNFIGELQTYWDSPKQAPVLKTASEEILALLYKNGIKAQYFNYCSSAFEKWESAYYGKNYKRLQKIKNLYDPNNTIRHPQSIRNGFL